MNNDLPWPNIVEPLDYETILAYMQTDLVRRDPAFTHLLESDPAIKVLEVSAWRELIIRQRVNDAARANLLSFATERDLDHLAAFYGVTRLTEETEAALRRRIQEKIMGWSTAGSRAHYRYHALSADVRVKDARADSPQAGHVRVAILSKDGSGLPTAELLQNVRDTVTADSVRVLTDTVVVEPCRILTVDIIADIYLYPDTHNQLMATIAHRFINALNTTRGLGWDLTRSWIIAQLFLSGVQRVELLTPAQDIIVGENDCVALGELKLTLVGRGR